MLICGYNATMLNEEFVKNIKEFNIVNTNDIHNLFEKAYEKVLKINLYPRRELDNSCQIILTMNGKYETRMYYIKKDEEVVIEDGEILLYPKDLCEVYKNPQLSSIDYSIENSTNKVLLRYLTKFINISEVSQDVSDTCCIVLLTNTGERYYIEENMYDLKTKLENNESIDNKFNELLQTSN